MITTPSVALVTRLREAGVSHDVLTWAEPYDDWEAAWQACPRGDWLLAFAARFGSSPAQIAIATLDAIRAALRGTYLEPICDKPLTDAKLAWQRGKRGDFFSQMQVANDPNAAMLKEALALTDSVDRHPEHAAAAASQILSTVVAASGDCASMAVVRYTHQVMADAVRRAIVPAPPLRT